MNYVDPTLEQSQQAGSMLSNICFFYTEKRDKK